MNMSQLPITPEAMADFTRAEDAQVSPDGALVAFVALGVAGDFDLFTDERGAGVLALLDGFGGGASKPVVTPPARDATVAGLRRLFLLQMDVSLGKLEQSLPTVLGSGILGERAHLRASGHSRAGRHALRSNEVARREVRVDRVPELVANHEAQAEGPEETQSLGNEAMNALLSDVHGRPAHSASLPFVPAAAPPPPAPEHCAPAHRRAHSPHRGLGTHPTGSILQESSRGRKVTHHERWSACRALGGAAVTDCPAQP